MPETAAVQYPDPFVYPPAVPPPPRLPEVLPPHDHTAAGQLEQIRDVLERWHDEQHPGSFRYCYERPCREIAGITRGLYL